MWHHSFMILIYLGLINWSLQELILVHALFRHGDRTIDEGNIYPNDPYKNETYLPYGLGQLTNKGKLREYELGQYLRNRYDDFLGEIYTPDIVDATSTSYNRTKMSLELVLAGLFPPKSEQIWHPNILWQPIPYNYYPSEEDKVLWGKLCPNFDKFYHDYLQSDFSQNLLNQYHEDFEYLANFTEKNVTVLDDGASIYFGLTAEYEWGLELPAWSDSVYPDLLATMAAQNYLVMTGTPELKQLMSGYFIQKVINDTTSRLAGGLPQERKIFLYAAHEVTIAAALIGLDVFELHIPPYGSCLIFEIHEIDGQIGFKVFYERDTSLEPKLLILPGCEEFCPLDKFVSLTDPFIADDLLCGR